MVATCADGGLTFDQWTALEGVVHDAYPMVDRF